jgi:hypothetical protein
MKAQYDPDLNWDYYTATVLMVALSDLCRCCSH